MLERFLTFIREHKLLTPPGKPVCLAISGGIDSVVMARLFHLAGIPFSVAHCNFRLRGEESDLDETFVRQLAADYKATFHQRSFETLAYAASQSISIQMAARELRMQWFGEMVKVGECDAVATAHHADDNIETFFINLLRGSGLAGLGGIRPRSGIIIHPILFASRNEIVRFAAEQKLEFREDSSNIQTKYLRNRIRHLLLPALDATDPGFRESITRSIGMLKDADEMLEAHIKSIRSRVLIGEPGQYRLPKKEIRGLENRDTTLYYLLRPFGFNFSVVADIGQALDGSPGKIFHSPSHSLLNDRDFLFIRALDTVVERQEYKLEQSQGELFYPVHLRWDIIERSQLPEIPVDTDKAFLDAAKLVFPLQLRKWEIGDTFCPLGMNKRKKLSDFFTDQKFSVFEKEDTWLLCSAGEIVWVVGHRIDHRYRITVDTQKVLKATLFRQIS